MTEIKKTTEFTDVADVKLGEIVPPTTMLDSDPDLIIITGMSGAGRTEAMHTFEDYGYFCIDNLPPRLLMNLVALANTHDGVGPTRKLCVVCDARNKNVYVELKEELAHLRDTGLVYRIVFLDASDDMIVARYKASRRIHPMCKGNNRTILEGIKAERELLSELREAANAVIDTTGRKASELRQYLRTLFSASMLSEGLKVNVYSFGFKHGAPADADLVIDVRFLPNPYYIEELRAHTGLEADVRDFVLGKIETKEFMENWKRLLACIMPGYEKEGKQQLTIGVGCTGGQHRSVALAEETGKYLATLGYNTHVTHRDLALADTHVEGK